MGEIVPGPAALPVPALTRLAAGVCLLQPLSRKGEGPGLIVLAPEINTNGTYDGLEIQEGIPSSLIKWAEEGYTMVDIREQAWTEGADPLSLAVSTLEQCDKCQPKEKIGLISYDPALWKKATTSLSSHPKIVGAVLYDDASAADSSTQYSIPILQHLGGKSMTKLERSASLTMYDYAEAKSCLFATPFQDHFIYSSESVSHTRNLTFLKKLINGPYFDLEAIWGEHTYWEFENRSVEHTMATMVQEPYVNHIPTMTGGIGRENLTNFYRDHFIFANPADTELELISRTVGIDRVIDEFIFKMTHDKIVDWFLPGIPPTNKYIQVPFTAIVNIRGDRLYHEHIAWDQTTALFQLGLMPEYLPFPSPSPATAAADSSSSSSSSSNKKKKKLEYRVPGAGVETAQKIRDKNSVVSNGLFEGGVREV